MRLSIPASRPAYFKKQSASWRTLASKLVTNESRNKNDTSTPHWVWGIVPLGGFMETEKERILYKLKLALQKRGKIVFPGIEEKEISLSVGEILFLGQILESIKSK
jgi:hypothetical protein